MNKNNKNDVIIFHDDNFSLEVNISPEEDTVWLTQKQIAELFEKDRKTITRHIKNIYTDDELMQDQVCSFFEHTASDGKKYKVQYYNLDMIISIGYRVKSKRGIVFRKWATSILKEYSIKGFSLNPHKINQQEQIKIYKLLGRITEQVETNEILDILENYALGLQLLDDYDHQRIQKPDGTTAIYQLTYEEAIKLV